MPEPIKEGAKLLAAGAAVVAAAAKQAQAQETVAWPDHSAARILGKRHPRIDGPAKVTGAAKYASDIVLPGMLHARVMRSPYAAARIASDADVDTSAAEKLPGVKAVIKLVGSGGKTIRYAGEEIAAVAAVSPEAADEAVRAIKVKYELRPFVVNEDKAANPAAPRVMRNTTKCLTENFILANFGWFQPHVSYQARYQVHLDSKLCDGEIMQNVFRTQPEKNRLA